MSSAAGKSKRTLQAVMAVILVLGLAALVVRTARKSDAPAEASPSASSAKARPVIPMVDVSDIPRAASVDATEIATEDLGAFLAGLRGQPLAQQAETLQHLVNLVEDGQYGPMGQLLLDAATPKPLLEILIADLMNREDEVKLPILRGIAANEIHSYRDVAMDVLEVYESPATAQAANSPE